jgi:hypothetical protein
VPRRHEPHPRCLWPLLSVSAMGAADFCEAPSDFSQPRRRKSGRPSEIGTPESRRSAAPMFDTPTATTHPRGVRSILKRIAAVVCVLTFAQGAAGLCAGWQTTLEARMQCCEDSACPLHRHEHGVSRTRITQAAADDCCAQSASPESSPSVTVFASTITLAVLQPRTPVVMSFAPAPLLAAPWETPSPPTHVPKHLLLSVLLV